MSTVALPDGAALAAAGAEAGGLLGLVFDKAGGGAISTATTGWTFDASAAARCLAEIERSIAPRWTWWSPATAEVVSGLGVRLARCWDLAAAHRLLAGGGRDDPGRVWALARELPLDAVPAIGPVDLFTPEDESSDEPLTEAGYLRPGWVRGGWQATPARCRQWARLVLTVAGDQTRQLRALAVGGDAVWTARSESTAELLGAELAATGLPIDRAALDALLTGILGPRPDTEAEADERRRARDQAVLGLARNAEKTDLRSPTAVREMLTHVGIDVPDTRSWRLKPYADMHPLVPALLAWRKAERIATTYGYAWMDRHIGADGRLRGSWRATDGAAGRMTASAGLHNLPAELRSAVAAESGHVFVRADLAQIEPRVLAVVSADPLLAQATAAADLYAPVAARLGVDRPTAKIAVLAAMYGQTSGSAGQALDGLRRGYPTAMGYLDHMYEEGVAGRSVRTYGGRLIALVRDPDQPLETAAARDAARGRYARNAVIQGAAAELFKAWACTVRAQLPDAARIVLCLHDELLVHAPRTAAEAVTGIVASALQDSAARWAPGSGVAFAADIRTIQRWSEAKE